MAPIRATTNYRHTKTSQIYCELPEILDSLQEDGVAAIDINIVDGAEYHKYEPAAYNSSWAKLSEVKGNRKPRL